MPRLLHRPAAEHPRPRGHREAQAPRSAPADPDQRRSRKDPHRSAISRMPSTPRRCDITYAVEPARDGMESALARLCDRAEQAVSGGYNIIILSDRMVGPDRIPIPALLATAAVHHHLIRKGLRTSVGLVVETGEAREVHHFACSPAMAPRRSIPISPSRRWPPWPTNSRRRSTARGGQALHQVDRQGHAQGHVQDGHLDLPVLLRRADLRCGRPVRAISSTKYFTGTATPIEGVGLDRDRRGDGARAQARLRRRAGLPQRARCRRRLCLPHARRGACLDAGHRSRCCSTRCAATATRNTAPTPRCSTSRASSLLTLRGLFRIKTPRRTAARPCRSRRSSRRPRSSSASRPAPCRSARSRARRTRRSPSP